MLLPAKKSKKWMYVLIGVFIINIAALYVSRIMAGSSMDTKNYVSFALISIAASIFSLAGFFGKRRFSYTYMAFNIGGIIYMLYITIGGKNNGWSDLTSIAGYMFLSLLGLLLGILTEVIGRKK